MAKFSLSRHDTQARVAAILSLTSCAALAALAYLVTRRMDWSQWSIPYGRARGMMVMGAGAITILLAATGFVMGLSSVGQRRNDKPSLSWLGFFVGAGVICLALVLLYMFRTRGDMLTY